MSAHLAAYEEQIRSSFATVDQLLARAPAPPRVEAFRQRLLGELVFDADLVSSTLTPEFELVSHAGGVSTTIAGPAMVAGLRASRGAAMWLDWDDLVIDEVLGGHGRLVTLLSSAAAAARGVSGVGPDALAVTSCPIAFFVRFSGDLMASEALYMDARQTAVTVLPDAAMPSAEHLLALVERTT